MMNIIQTSKGVLIGKWCACHRCIAKDDEALCDEIRDASDIISGEGCVYSWESGEDKILSELEIAIGRPTQGRRSMSKIRDMVDALKSIFRGRKGKAADKLVEQFSNKAAEKPKGELWGLLQEYQGYCPDVMKLPYGNQYAAAVLDDFTAPLARGDTEIQALRIWREAVDNHTANRQRNNQPKGGE